MKHGIDSGPFFNSTDGAIRARVIAHRGYWFGEYNQTHFEKNSIHALQRAAECGLGIETDLRDSNGKLVISHDPALEGSLSSSVLNQFAFKGAIALNIKSDGLLPLIKRDLSTITLQNAFFFDMSFPQMLQYCSSNMKVAARISEYEVDITGNSSESIWLDAFNSDWWADPKIMDGLLESNKKYFIVSPELHGRDPKPAWQFLKSYFFENQTIHICTDKPQKFLEAVHP